MTEIVERLERQAVNVENDGHVSAARAMREAATALTEARAEIKRLAQLVARLQAALMFWMPSVYDWLDDATRERSGADAYLLADYSGPLDLACWGDEILERAIAAESDLSDLRRKAREVVGGMLAHSCVADAGPDCKDEEDEAAERAARRFIEE